MQVTDWLSAIGIGIVIGVLGRLVLPGRQRIGVFVTLLIGVGSSLLGVLVGNQLGLDTKAVASYRGYEWSWVVFGIQVGVAVLLTAGAAMLTHTRLAHNDKPKKARPAKKASAKSAADR